MLNLNLLCLLWSVDSGRFNASLHFPPGSTVEQVRVSGSTLQCLICLNDLKSRKDEAIMLAKHLVTLLFSVLLFVSCDNNNASCFPESLCNTTFSDPSFLKTMSSNIVHIGVSLRIIDNNNVKENATRPAFNEGFKVRQIPF